MPPWLAVSREWLRQNLAWSTTRRAWEERVGLLVLLAGIACLALLHDLLGLPALLFVGALFGVALAVLWRRGWLKLFGPVLFYDLVRVARRKRYFLVRTLYAGLLLFFFCQVFFVWSYRGAGEIQAKDMANFAGSFFYTFMAVQFTLVVLLTPAYVGGAVAEEKDRRTLDFTLATDLEGREIILSKLAARLLNLALLVLVGLPILSFTQFLGGVDPNLVLAGFAATAVTMASVGSLSMLSSVYARRSRDAIVLTYLVVLAYVVLSFVGMMVVMMPLGWGGLPLIPFWPGAPTVSDLVDCLAAGNLLFVVAQLVRGVAGGTSLADLLLDLLRNYAIFHGLVVAVCLTWAVLRLRPVAQRQGSEAPRKPSRLRAPLMQPRFRPPIGNRPMNWKEQYVETGLRFNWMGRIAVNLLVIATFLPLGLMLVDAAMSSRNWSFYAEGINAWVRVIGTGVACLLLVGVAVRSATGVTGERERQTWDGLLTTPLGSTEILSAKWWGSMLSVRWAWVWLGLVWALAIVGGGLHPFAVPLMALGWVCYASLLASLGLWFSMTAASSQRATVGTLLATALVSVGQLVPLMCCPVMSLPEDSLLTLVMRFQLGLSPPAVFGYLLPYRGEDFTRGSDPQKPWHFIAALAGMVCWAVAALVVWFVIRDRFQAVTGRLPLRRVPAPPTRSRDAAEVPAAR